MALQNFVDRVGPVISSAWLNVVDSLKFSVFADATTKAAARAALTSDAPMSVGQGGTSATTTSGALSSLLSGQTDGVLPITLGGTGSSGGIRTTLGTFGTVQSIAAAATVDLGTAGGTATSNGHVVNVTGAASIYSFGSTASTAAPFYLVRFAGANTLNNSVSMVLLGNANITTASGDTCLMEYQGSSVWKMWWYQQYLEAPIVSGTFTPAWVGLTSFPSAPVSYTKVKDLVCLTFSNGIDTSNSTGYSFTGLPAALRLVSSTTRYIPIMGMEDNGTILTAPSIMAIDNTDTVILYKTMTLGTNPWTNSGTKGVFANAVVTYSIR